MSRKPNRERDFDSELSDLPPELRWCEWKARVEAVLFAAAKPVGRDILARVVGRDCPLDLLLDDLKEDLRGRPIELVRAGEGLTLHTRPAFGPALRVAFDIPADAKALTKLEAGVLMAVAYFQPVTRGELSETFGREISRDLIAGLRAEGLIAAGPRSPTPGAPYAYVTTEKFLLEFGFESLRDLPDLEALKDAGLLSANGPNDEEGGGDGSMRPDRTDAIRRGNGVYGGVTLKQATSYSEIAVKGLPE
jgi:segregation and condensation protein B